MLSRCSFLLLFFAAPALLLSNARSALAQLPEAPRSSLLLQERSSDAGAAGAQSNASQNPANSRVADRASAPPAGETFWTRKYFLGDWNGERTRLAEKGFVFDLYYTDDALGNPRGGRSDFAVWGRVRGTVDVDFSKFTRVQGLTLHVTGLWQYGTDLSKQYTFTAVDSTSLPSAHTLRADSYFLQQYLLHHKVAIRAGQIAGYDTYADSEYGASFINLAMGYANSNLNQATYLAFNPAGVPSFELKVLPTDHLYVKSMVQSQEPDPYNQDPTGLRFHLGGPLVASEIGYLVDPPRPPDATYTMGQEPFITPKETGIYPGSYKFGSVYNPHKFTDQLTGAQKAGNYLIYAQANQAVYRVGKQGIDSKRGLDLTYSEEYSPGDVAQYSHQTWLGARWVGPARGRFSKDAISFGYVRTSVGSHAREASLAAGGPALTAEHLLELNYQVSPTPWLLFQPVAQWFIKPAGDANREAVFVAGFRTKLTF